MRYFITIGLLAFALVGCAESRHQAALQVWRSPDSTLKQRADAVSKLIPKGTSKQTVICILGEDGCWTCVARAEYAGYCEQNWPVEFSSAT